MTTSRLRVYGLRVDDLAGPLGHDERLATLSWRIQLADDAVCEGGEVQTAYEVQAASSPQALSAGKPDLWGSERVESAEQRAIWSGNHLESRMAIWWRVRAWDALGLVSEWSSPGRFEMGLLSPSDWLACWVTHPDWLAGADDGRERLFVKDFVVAREARCARLYVAGLGAYVASLNGHRVGDIALEPPNTRFEARVIYACYDVTQLLRPGPNTLGVRVADGVAHVGDPRGRFTKFVGSHAERGLIAQLELHGYDGTVETVASDVSWLTLPGPTLWSHWYGGEDYDATKEVAGWDEPGAERSGWVPAVPDPHGRRGRLAARRCPPVRVVEVLKARGATTLDGNAQVFDFGLNIAGWPCLDVDLPAGRNVRLHPFEQLDADGQPIKPYDSFDTYVTRAGRQRWHPEFCYHGFRYVEVSGAGSELGLDNVQALVLRAANDRSDDFETSEPLVNGIHGIIDRAVQGNMMSVLTDCPHREKLGWLEQTHLLFDVVAGNYDVAAYYQELVRDMVEAQTEDGLVPSTAPEYVVFERKWRDEPNWGSAIVLVPYQHYRWYGEKRVLEMAYPAMQHYVEYLSSQEEPDGTLDYGLGDWYSVDGATPAGVTATWGYHKAVSALAEIAEVLGRDEDASSYAKSACTIRNAFARRFHDPVTGLFGADNQSCDALALDMNVVPDDRRAQVVARLAGRIVETGYHLTAGEVVLPSLLRVVSAAGQDELLFRVAKQTSSPSYGYQLVHGATSLTEAWDGPTVGHSQNHFMLGGIEAWFASKLAGIDQEPGSVGHRSLRIAPAVLTGLRRARGGRNTPYGRVATRWVHEDGRFELTLDLPVGTKATVLVPAGNLVAATTRGGNIVVEPATLAGGVAMFEVSAGRWLFRSDEQTRRP